MSKLLNALRTADAKRHLTIQTKSPLLKTKSPAHPLPLQEDQSTLTCPLNLESAIHIPVSSQEQTPSNQLAEKDADVEHCLERHAPQRTQITQGTQQQLMVAEQESLHAEQHENRHAAGESSSRAQPNEHTTNKKKLSFDATSLFAFISLKKALHFLRPDFASLRYLMIATICFGLGNFSHDYFKQKIHAFSSNAKPLQLAQYEYLPSLPATELSLKLDKNLSNLPMANSEKSLMNRSPHKD